MPTDSERDTLARHFVVILNRTGDIVNIAGTARAMMNMGFERLRLVRPDLYDAHRIAGIAHGAEPLLERVEFFDTLRDAIADTGLVIGTTARRRTSPYVWDQPREAAPRLLSEAPSLPGPVALVFGREDTGLLNDELDLCSRLLVVPTHDSNRSLNLAQAVLLVLYELRMAAIGQGPALPLPKRRSAPVAPIELDRLFKDTEVALDTIEFFKKRNEHMIMRSIRAIIRRAQPSARETRLLRAIAIEIRKFFERYNG
jgi:tRNA (cytidine32/uridine32-2'-O)-methyltransferase